MKYEFPVWLTQAACLILANGVIHLHCCRKEQGGRGRERPPAPVNWAPYCRMLNFFRPSTTDSAQNWSSLTTGILAFNDF